MLGVMENDILRLFALALLPVVGMVLGALAAEKWRLSHRALGAVLHAAAGVATAVVSIELMPQALGNIAPWQLVVGFLLGALVSVLMANGVRRAVKGLGLGQAGAWKVYLVTAVDLFGDGLMVGIGSAVAGGLGFVLALSQVIANLPGGFVTVAQLRSRDVSRKIRLGAAASLFVPVFIGAAAGYWLLRGQSDAMQNAALAFVAGLLLLATIEDLVPEADEPETPRWITTASFAAGFCFFALIALYVD